MGGLILGHVCENDIDLASEATGSGFGCLAEGDRPEVQLYIHIPFCEKKCDYCDFLSMSADSRVRRDYVDALLREIDGLEGGRCVTVFFGGGTPSILPASWICEIMESLRARFDLAEDAEITIEANPGTVDREKLTIYRAAGINRISFGCQSACDTELAELGRIHNFQTFLESFQLAREAGFSNINVDLMFGIPGQTVASWEESLRRVAQLMPEHISAYSLILEKGTPLAARVDAGNLPTLPEEDKEREMFEMTGDLLVEQGYAQYEISNYAKPGFACRHNIGYWRGAEYLGLGLGAASFTGDIGAGNVLHRPCMRYSNTGDMEEYLRDSGDRQKLRREVETLTRRDLQSEFMILGLRMTEGVSVEEFRRRFGEELTAVYGETIRKYETLGLLTQKGGRVLLTRQGLSLANVVMREFLS